MRVEWYLRDYVKVFVEARAGAPYTPADLSVWATRQLATTDFYQIGSFSILESQLRALGRLAGLTYDEVSGYITRVWTSGPSQSQPRSPALTTPEVKVTGTAAVAAAGGRADGIPAPDYGVGSPPRSPPRLGSGDGAGSPGRCAACGVALSLRAKLRAAGPCVLTAKRMRLARAMRLRGRRPRRMERLRRPLGRAALE